MIQSLFAAKRTDQIQRHPKKEGPSSPAFLARLSTPARIFDRSSTLANFRQSPPGGILGILQELSSPIIIPAIFEIETTEKRSPL